MIEGVEVPIYIHISQDWESPKGEPAATQYIDITDPYTGEMAKGIFLIVYQHAFESIAHLYHAIGHEGCHVYDLMMTNGKINRKELEFNGYTWNFKHRYGPYPYPYDLDNLFNIINQFMPGFLRRRIPG